MKISVLVPVYGVEKYIERCARSLFEQTMQEGVEFVFVNDCTKDNSIQVLERLLNEYPQRAPFVKIIHHETNQGIAATRNTTLNHASGDYVCMVDSDDYVELNMLEVLYNKATATGADIVSASYVIEYETSAKIEQSEKRDVSKETYILGLIKSKNVPSWWSRLYKREIFERNKLRLIPGMNLGEDLITVPKVFYYAEKIAFIEDRLYHYVRYNSGSITRTQAEDLHQHVAPMNELSRFFEDQGTAYQDAIEYRKMLSAMWLAMNGTPRKSINKGFGKIRYMKHFGELNNRHKIVVVLVQLNALPLLHALVKGWRKIRVGS